MTIDDKIRDEKLLFDVNREVAKTSALSFGKIDKYEYLTGEKILPSNQRKIIEQAKFACSPLEKAFEKQIETIEELRKKQVNAITNQNKTLETLTNKNIYNEIFDKTVKEKFDEIRKLTNETNHDCWAYYFKGDTDKERFDDCNWTRTHNHLVHKRTLNHLAKLASLAKWLSVRL